MRTSSLVIIAAFVFVLAGAFILFVPAWQAPPHVQEVGYRALDLLQFSHPHDHQAVDDPPRLIPAAAPGGPSAVERYKNVKVLTDLSANDFMRVQVALTEWVAPQQGCGFCHAGTDYASDANPRKLVARTMLLMTRHINADWKSHVGAQGVTCYTCHRGQNMPPKAWFLDIPKPAQGILGKPSEFNESAETVRDFFPNYGFSEYLLEDNPIHVQSRTSAPTGSVATQAETKRIYEMMMQMSDGTGVNCTYCHNSRDFATWDESPPGRWTGYYAIKMTRDLNQHYVFGLRAVMPLARVGPNRVLPPTTPPREMGPLDGNGLVTCATCHIGNPHPLNGADMLKDYPSLAGPGAQAQVAAAHAAAHAGGPPPEMAAYVRVHAGAAR